MAIGHGAAVARGTVVQTHLFHDRVMQLDTVRLDDGATLGPHSVALPAAGIGAGATVGPASLVMRGEQVPGARSGRATPSHRGRPRRRCRSRNAPPPPRDDGVVADSTAP